MIRTVRRFLERYGNKVDALLFVFADQEEQRPYEQVRLAAREQRERCTNCAMCCYATPFAVAKGFAALFSAEQG
eukprot:COSAG02_NODE_13219_length_1424_cov_2.345660_3_plen_74_part_00